MTTTRARPASAAPAAQEGPREPRRGRILWGIRSRFLLWYVVILAVAIGAAVLVVRQILITRTDQRIHEALVQESQELRRLARGRDPTTGEPFEDRVKRIFDVFLARNIPSRNETFLTFVDGEPFERSFRPPPYRLHRDPALMERWAELSDPDRGRVETPAGTVEYLAIPVKRGEATLGVFVAAIFRDLELAEVRGAVAGAAAVGGATLLIGSLLAWRVTEGLLRRVGAVTHTAWQIATGDHARRLEVSGHDEMSRLAATFNDMLDRLEEVVETQRRFVDDAGHELRTPITVIRGHLELMDDDPEERARTLALVSDEFDRMQRIVDELLLLAQAQRADFLALEPVRLDTLIQDVYDKARALGPRDWRIVPARAAAVLVGDRQRLTQAMMQLAQNAVQHTAEGAEVEIGASPTDGEARLWVRDTGAGIAETDKERIFQRFARGGDRRPSDGAGLGLAIVQAIAEAHFGRVELESQVGTGSTFTIVVPVDQPLPRPEEGA